MFIDSTLYKGRPGDETGRLPKELRCYDLLDSLGMEYFRADHEHADTIEVCHEVEKVVGSEICKNLFLCNRQQTEFYLLMMPGDKPFKTKILSKEIGTARLSFGSAEFMEQLLDLAPGSVTALGLMNDKAGRVKLLIDRDLIKDEFISGHPCISTSTIKMKTSEFIEKLLPAIAHEPMYVDLPWETED